MPDQEELRSRAFWSGTITFGLVSIPVNLFSGARSHSVPLRMLSEEWDATGAQILLPETRP